MVQRGRKGDDALREAVSHQVAQLHELETKGRDRMDPGGRHEPHHQVGLRLNCLHVTTPPPLFNNKNKMKEIISVTVYMFSFDLLSYHFHVL